MRTTLDKIDAENDCKLASRMWRNSPVMMTFQWDCGRECKGGSRNPQGLFLGQLRLPVRRAAADADVLGTDRAKQDDRKMQTPREILN
ncbi:hypothetical protein GVN24_12390 [Rhizobium sp. CRIBSB]|nr:hypothetical protein [Rhizobium sp. CRIBSB]